jgi:hypothetical protein
MPDLFLDIRDDLAGIGLVPAPVQVLGGQPELDDEIAGKVLRPDLARFSRQSRIRAASSSPMMIRASEPPMKVRLLPTRALFLRYCDMIPFLSESKRYLRYYNPNVRMSIPQVLINTK